MKTWFILAAFLLLAAALRAQSSAAELANLPVSLRPLPNSEALKITVATSERVELSLRNSAGRLALRRSFRGSVKLFLEELPPGAYTLRLQSPRGTALRQIVLQEEK